MERKEIILRSISKDMLGVEIGPYHSPLVPKREGYRSLGLDLHTQDQLRINARRDPNISCEGVDRIETVDLVGSATDLAELIEEKGLLGQIDYVVSSHNFEHLPDPISFLRACARVLKPDGLISMAVPDRRGCFDYFRPHATTADFLAAFINKAAKPTINQLLLHQCLQSRRSVEGCEAGSWDYNICGEGIYAIADLDDVKSWVNKLPPEHERPYADTHCQSFTISSFELIIRDLHFMGYIDFGIERMTGPLGHEFFALLKKRLPVPSKPKFYSDRTQILHRVLDETSINSSEFFTLQRQLSDLVKKEREQQALIQSMIRSRSWRFTAPFRKLRQKST